MLARDAGTSFNGVGVFYFSEPQRMPIVLNHSFEMANGARCPARDMRPPGAEIKQQCSGERENENIVSNSVGQFANAAAQTVSVIRPGVNRFEMEVEKADGGALEVQISSADAHVISKARLTSHCNAAKLPLSDA
jgi:hypothetical protein